jgi:hypothetical protein
MVVLLHTPPKDLENICRFTHLHSCRICFQSCFRLLELVIPGLCCPLIYHRPRRLRSNDTLRRMVRETVLSPNDLIYPLRCRGLMLRKGVT